jgi:ankyrin repeat protein
VEAADLFSAIRAADLEGVDRILTDRPALAQASDASGMSALTVAAYNGQWPIVERIRAADPDLDRFEAAIVGDLAVLEARLDEAEREAEIERETADGRQARRATYAAGGSAGDGARATLPTVDEPSPDGFSALHLAAFFGRPEVARRLLDRGADPNPWATGGLHVQPLHSAVAGGHESIAAMLVDAGADVNAVQDGGFTPLMGAAQNGLVDTVALLLAHGADPNALDQDILTAADHADRAGHPDVVAAIRAAAA